MIQVECAKCGKEIQRFPYQLRDNQNSYCSRNCQNKHIWEVHRESIIEKQNIGKNKESKLKEVICENCGEIRLHYYPTRRFCSRKCSNEFLVGENSQSWKGGLSSQNEIERKRKVYSEWRKQVFERDDYTCQKCDIRSGNGRTIVLNAHHIKSFAQYPELRIDVDNGITLCYECHMEEHRKW